MKKWGNKYMNMGFFPVSGKDMFVHYFGGETWRIEGIFSEAKPVLLLDLNLEDPKISNKIGNLPVKRLPIVSIINAEDWWPRQEYTFDHANAVINWIEPNVISNIYPFEDWVKSPLNQIQVILEAMTFDDCPSTEEKYWLISEGFLGGEKFIRIIGSPYWLQDPLVEFCRCGINMNLIVSIGYELQNSKGKFSSEPFFIGEAALYFFLCYKCSRIHVIPQST